MRRRVYGFFSYAHEDDALTGVAVSALRVALEKSVRLRVRQFELYQDTKDLKPGQDWKAELFGAIDASVFFFPVLSPGFFESEWCRGEAERALVRQKEAPGRLVIPLYFLRDHRFDEKVHRRKDELRTELHTLQYSALVDTWHAGWESERGRAVVAALAGDIAERIERAETEAAIAEEVVPLLATGDLAGAARELRELERPADAADVERIARLGDAAQVEAARTHVGGYLGAGWSAFVGVVGVRVEAARVVAAREAAEQAEREAVERAAREKAEREAAEKAQREAAERAEREAAEKAARETAQREAAAKAAREQAEREAATRPGARSTLRLATTSIDLAYIPAGTFKMGSPNGIGDGDEHPQHEVRISRPFRVGVFTVTQAQWVAVMKDNPSQFKGDQRPVETVTWFDAVRWCNAASAAAGLPQAYTINGDKVTRVPDAPGFRLPTEAEWEYACRAGTTSGWSHGDDEAKLAEYAWYGLRDGTRDVGQKRANPWALHDVHGNVWEWCEDDRRPYSAAAVTDPAGAPGVRRVFRGGGWLNSAVGCRSACRSGGQPDGRYDGLGFRVVLPFPRAGS